MNKHEEVWIDGNEYDLVHVLRSTYWEVILVGPLNETPSKDTQYVSLYTIPVE